MNKVYDRRFLFVTGKGGVGKTTVTATLALTYAALGKRVLCASCNAKERFSTLFGTEPVGPEIQPLAKNVWGINMNPARAMEEYGLMVLRSKTLYRTVFDNRYVRSFFRATPGLYEWAMLGKAWWHTTDDAAKHGQHYDVVILDAPATGHGLDMLRVPKVIVDVAPPGILRRDAERAWTMFQDPVQAGVMVVTLPEDMVVNETQELLTALHTELHLPVAGLLVNSVWPTLFSPAERTILLAAALENLQEDTPGRAALGASVRRASREHIQAESITRLATMVPGPQLHQLPFLFEGVASLPQMRVLQEHLKPLKDT